MAPTIDRAKPLEDLLARFAKIWERFYGCRYLDLPADRAALGRFLGGLKRAYESPEERWAEIDRLPDIFERYLRDRNDYTMSLSKNHSLNWLMNRSLNQYRARERLSRQEMQRREQREHEERKRQGRSMTPSALIIGLAELKSLPPDKNGTGS